MEFHVTLCGMLCCAIALFFPLSYGAGIFVNHFFVKKHYKMDEVPHDMHPELLWDDEDWPVIIFWSKIGVAIFYALFAVCIIACSCRRRRVEYIPIQN